MPWWAHSLIIKQLQGSFNDFFVAASFIQVDLKTNSFFPLLEVNLYGIYTIFDFCYDKTTDKLYFGSISKDLVTKRIDNKSGYELTHQAGSPIEIDLDGIIYFKGFEKDRIESWKLIVK